MSIRAPRPIEPGDPVGAFRCNETELNAWLADRALGNESSRSSRTFVAMDDVSRRIAGYVTLAASSLDADGAPGRLRRNQPNPIPVILIGRLAVDAGYEKRGLGSGLLQFALSKALEASLSIGARAIVVDAMSESAAAFYRHHGFIDMPRSGPASLYLLTTDLVRSVI